MDTGTDAAELQARIKRLEDQLKVFRLIFAFAVFAWIGVGSQIWQGARSGVIRARQFEVVDAAGKSVAELSQENGRAGLVLFDAAYKPAAEFSVFGSAPSIAFYDGEQKQRAILGMLAGAPTLAMHDSGGDVRALLTADRNASTFWLKNKDGSATIFGNAINETREFEIIDGKVVPHDTVQTTSVASIRIQDAKRKVLWKAP